MSAQQRLTFYAYLGSRRTKVPVPPALDELPSDWVELKQFLAEAMAVVHANYGKTEADVSLERHRRGKFTVRFSGRGYSIQPLRYQREYEAFFKLRYVPKTGDVEVSRANFSWTLHQVAQEFYQMEKGIGYRVPPLIPMGHRQSVLENPKTLLRLEPEGSRYADYTRKPQHLYDRISEAEEPPMNYRREPITTNQKH